MNESKLKKPERAESASARRGSIKRKRILLAESDGFLRLVLMFRFRVAGFEVDFTSNGRVALRKLRTRRPDVIVADITLNGGLSGLEMMRTARSDSAFGSRPIYAFTHAERMSWATRMELRSLDTKVFDKGSSDWDLVETLVRTVLEREGAGNATFEPGPVAQEIILLPEIEEIIARVRRQARAVARRRAIRTSAESFGELRTLVCALASCSEAIGLRNLVRQSKALELLLAQLCKEKKNHTRAAMGTVVRAAQVIKTLAHSPAGTSRTLTPFSAVVVDKAPASNKAALQALTEAGFHAVGFEGIKAAGEYLSSNQANLIIVNVLPADARGLSSTDLERLPRHASTPIIFVYESLIHNPSCKEAPRNVPLLNETPLLLKELIMKALNEVQRKRPLANASTPPQARPATGQVSVQGSKASELRAERAPNPGKKTVLFVEDDPFVVKAYQKRLVAEGFDVEVAEDGLIALKMLPKLKPDVVVLDLMLPKVHGLEVLRFIRADSKLKHIPVLVLSNAYLEELAAKANAAGATRGLLKTQCSPARLVEVLCELVGRALPPAPPKPVLREPKMAAPRDQAPSILAQELVEETPKEILKIRQACLDYIKTNSDGERAKRLTELYRAVRSFGARAGLSGFAKLAELCSALEGLLFQLIFKETQATASTMQTIAQAVDSIDRLAEKRDTGPIQTNPKARVLVVDDDEVCNFAIVSALKRSDYDSVGIQNPVQALDTLKARKFDLILLDVEMPQLSGFHVCEQLRQLPQYKSVPVIFITLETDFKNRARSILARGNDVVAKPVCRLELIVRVTIHLINSGEQNESALAVAAKAAIAVLQPDTASPRPANTPETSFIIAREASLPAPTGSSHFIQSDPRPTVIEQRAGSQLEQIPDLFKKGPSASHPEITAIPETRPTAVVHAGLQRGPAGPVNHPQSIDSQLDKIPDVFKKAPTVSPQEQTVVAEAGPAVAVSPGLQKAPTSTVKQPQSGESQLEEIPDIFRKGPSSLPQERTVIAEAGPEEVFRSHRVPTVTMRHPQPAEPQPDEIPDIFKKAPAPSQKGQTAIAETSPEEVAPSSDEDAPERSSKEHETLLNRLSMAEKELQRTIAEIERREQQIKELTRQVTDLAAHASQSAQPRPQLDHAPIETEERRRAELELAQTRHEQEELNKQLTSGQQALAEVNRHVAELEGRLQQKSAELERARTETEKQKRQFEGALAEFRKELYGQIAKEQQAAADAIGRSKQLENALAASSTELKRSQAELDKQNKEKGEAISELRRQLELASATGKLSDTAQKQAKARCELLEQELLGQRQKRQTLEGELAKVTAESGARIKQLETDLGSSSTQLKRTQAELEKQNKEQSQVNSELRQQLELVAATGKLTEAVQKQAVARCGQLEQELATQRKGREALEGQLARVTAESSVCIKQLETDLGVRSTELKRTQAELEKQSKEQGQAISALRRQLEQATTTGKETETAHKQAQTRCGQLEQELAGQRKAREALEGQLATITAESSERIKQLETDLGGRSTELKRTQTELEKQSKEQGQAISALRRQLEQATTTGKETETAHKQAQTRCGQLEQELAGQRKAREALEGQLATITAESSERIKQLETDLGGRSTELKRTQAELEKQSKEQGQAISALRRQLEQATTTGKETETAHKQAQTRCGQLEQELAGQRKEREAFEGQLARITAESSERIKQLETDLGGRSTELKRIQAELEKQSKEQGQAISELRCQLEQASAAAKETDSAHKQARTRCDQLEQELAGLRRGSDALSAQLAKEQQVAAESLSRIKQLETALGTSSIELKSSKAELDKQTKEQGQIISELRRQLGQATAAGKESEAAHKQAQARCGQLEQDLADVRKGHEALESQLAKEQQAAAESISRIKQLESALGTSSTELKSAKAELEKQSKEQRESISELRLQLERATAAGKETDAAQKQAQARCGQLEQELAGLRRGSDTLGAQLAKEQQVAAESLARIKQLESALGTSSTELKSAKAELEKRSKDHGMAEKLLRQQLEAANASLKQSETAAQDAQVRHGQLDQELGGLRKAHQELTSKLAKEQQLAFESGARINDLESSLASASSDLARAKDELGDLEKRLQSTEAGRQAQITELDQRVRQGVAALAQANAELVKERGQRQRTEQRALESQRLHLESIANLEAKLRQAEQALAQRQADMEHERAERQLAEEQSQTARELNAQLHKNVASFDEARQTFDSSRQDLESRLSASLSAMQENESKLQRELAEHQRVAHALEKAEHDLQRQTQQRESLEQQLHSALESLKSCEAKWHAAAADRQRLNEALEAVQLNLRDHSRRSELEASQLKSALHLEQVERKKQETEIARWRQNSLDAARTAHVMHAGLRKELREPVANLSASAQGLLALEMGERQKKLAEAVLHDALRLHARLQEPETPLSDSNAGAQESEETDAGTAPAIG